MSVANVTGSAHVQSVAARQNRGAANHKSLDHARVGEEVNLRILQKIADGRFLATDGDARYTVDSALQFVVGQTVKATVSAVGGIVELKYVGAGQFEAVDAPASIAENDRSTLIDKLEGRYKRTLSDSDRALVARMSARAENEEAMTMSGLYLDKVGAPLQEMALHAIYAQQVWHDEEKQSPQAVDISALIAGANKGQENDITALAKVLGDAVEQSTSSATQVSDVDGQSLASVAGQGMPSNAAQTSAQNDDSMLTELAHRLLNAQDSRSIAHHYGSLPVLINNQLVELDLLMFRERESPQHAQGLRKLVMTLKTETLGRVEIVAQSLDNTLSVSIATQSPEATERLAGQAQEVRELVTRLGWNVDSVSYRLTNVPTRAAEQLVRHVLTSGSLDAVV